MRNYIILNDQNSNDISGLLIQSLAPISKPLMRTEIEEIDGRDGDITTKLGYSAYDKQITIGLFGNYDVDQVISFFNSEGTAIFSNEPDKYYNYQIVDQIDFERLVRYKTATVTMHCQPFKYSTTEGADILSSSANFATLNQSLNTDSSFYTYSSNVQADITATRQSGTGGKFFAVFTVPVVQGVNYHFSGNVSRNVSMYGYTDQLRGTSAGIAGKGFSGNFVYTATFTGTMVLGFYSNATTEIFIRNFAISNEAGSTVSAEGTNLVLEGSQLAPFNHFDLKGNTVQDGTPTPSSPVPVQVVTGENTVKIRGKNLLNASAVEGTNRGITFGEASSGSISISGKTTTTYAISPVATATLAAGTYTLSIDKTLTFGFGLATYSSGTRVTHYIAAGSKSLTFTLSSAADGYDIYITGVSANTDINETLKVQLEKSNQATDWDSYQEQSYEVNLGNIELCKIGTYQDYIWKDGDTWKVHKATGKVVLDGSESGWEKTTAYTGYFRGMIKIGEKPADYAGFCDHFTVRTGGHGGYNYVWNFLGDNSKYVQIEQTIIGGDTLALFQTWLSQNNVNWYYALATPTDTAITNTALIEQLDAIANQAHAYKTRTYVDSNAATGNVPHIIAAAVTGDADGTVTNSGNIYSKPKLTIFGTGDIGVYLNGVQMFQIALGTSGYITIDTALMEAYQDNLQTLMNRQVTGDYSNFVLNPGENTISFTGSVSMCVVENYSRWL